MAPGKQGKAERIAGAVKKEGARLRKQWKGRHGKRKYNGPGPKERGKEGGN